MERQGECGHVIRVGTTRMREGERGKKETTGGPSLLGARGLENLRVQVRLCKCVNE